ncbi:MAG TPA: translation initiation factor IF-2 [Dehalococcoidales bacterium]|nr:translation initiation factor IF-2 [Dehalococcoidales bacterium]
MVGSSKQNDAPRPVAERDNTAATPVKAQQIKIPSAITVKQLAELLQVSPVDTIKRLMRRGVMANVNQVLEFSVAATVATDYGYEVRKEPLATRKAGRVTEVRRRRQLQTTEEAGGLKPRAPVVTIMGHVNHGKTRLLDTIRQTNVMDHEAGGITQHIGAYQVEVNGQRITFLDTPGHEAFTAMRARGAQVTDITILVVAADDGVMPQTLEAIDHARAAGVPIVVAINKIDRPEANPDLVKQQLADAGLLIEEWGGDTVCVQISAREKLGIDELLSNLMVVAEMEELKADPSRSAEGVVIEAEMDKFRGPMGTVLVHSGTLRLGDTVVVGDAWGRVKAMFNDAGKRVKRAGPSTPVEVLGLNGVPQVGDVLTVTADERQAQSLIEKNKAEREREGAAPRAVNLSNVYEQLSTGRVKELNIVMKADVQGSIEPIRTSLEQIAEEEVKVRVIHSGPGNVTESDVMLAIASKAVIIGFNTGSEIGARRLAELEGVSIRYYDVIYNLVDDIAKALKGMLEPTYVEVIEGHAEVRAIFSLSRREKVAGVYVTEGRMVRGASIRVLRNGQVVHESVVSSLRRFKEDAREVASGYECGVGARGFTDFEVGDILEVFRTEEAG